MADIIRLKAEIQQLKEWIAYYRRLKDYARADKYAHELNELKKLTKVQSYGTTNKASTKV